MSAHERNRVSTEWPKAIWPHPEVQPVSVPDGPLAVISAALDAAKRHKLFVAAWMITCVGVAVLYAIAATPMYTATATLLLEPRRQAGSGSAEGSLGPSLDVGRAESELQVLRSERLLANVYKGLNLANNVELGTQGADKSASSGLGIRRLLGIPDPSSAHAEDVPSSKSEVAQQRKFEAFAERLSVRRVGQSYAVEVSYTSPDPTLARRIATAAVSAYLWQSIAAKADAAKNGAEFLQGRVNALTSQARSAAAAVANGSLPDAPTPDADARVIGAALQPLSPSAPRKTLIVGLGVTVGLVGSLLAVAIRQAFDRRIRSRKDLIQRAGTPCLALIPDDARKSFSKRVSADELRKMKAPWLGSSRFTSGIRDLRTSIQLAFVNRIEDGGSVVALVGCSANSGTSLISLSLARAIHDSGCPVTMVDADIYGSPARSAANGLATWKGLCLADLLAHPSRISGAKLQDIDGIAVMPARLPNTEVTSNAYLGAPAFQKVVNHLQQESFVILDLPCLSVSTDIRVAAQRADAVVIVAVAGRTTVEELTETVNGLKSVGANIIGAVLNRG
ncbi:MAG: Wzz/FepE/Etk N-terminal domain-containing protein [Methylobacterium radiotolerans]